MSGTTVPVFNNSGSQIGVAVTNPVTGAVELVGPGGSVLGVVQQQNGAVNLIGAGGAVLGSFAVNQANGQITLAGPGTAGGATAASSTSATGASPTSTTTTTSTGTTTTTGGAMSAASVPVFNSSGGQVGVAVTNPATGAVELVGPGGSVLGVVQQQNGAVSLVGAGGAVQGSFAVNQANGMVIFMPATTAAGTSGSTASTGTASTGTATTGTATTAATSGTAVPVFSSSGTQVGVAETNPATGTLELVGVNGNLLGVIVQQNGAVNLVGGGGAVQGSFAVNQANGEVIFTPAATTTGTAATTTGTATTTAATTTSRGVASAAPVPVFDSMGLQVGVAVTNPATGAVELVGPGGSVLGVAQQQNGAVNLVGAGGAVLGSFAVNQGNGQITFTTTGGASPSGSTSPAGGISG